MLRSGKRSQHYFDCKQITLMPEYLSLLADALADELFIEHSIPIPKAIGGMTLGADPITYALSLFYQKRRAQVYPFIVRKQEKAHGLSSRLECILPLSKTQANTALLIEDTITTASASIEALRLVRSMGFSVTYCIAVIDREEGAKENLAKEGVSLRSLYCASDFLPKPT